MIKEERKKEIARKRILACSMDTFKKGKKIRGGGVTEEYGRCMLAKVDILFLLNFAKYVNFIQSKMSDKT